MNRHPLRALVAAGISAAIGAATISANAAPLATTPQMEAGPYVILAKYDQGFHWQNGQPYYRGYKGSPHHRHGYREYNGFWFPLAAFGLGALLGGMLSNSNNAHVDWCYQHYKSYRAYDNTYQPYHGPRRQCRSPYG